MSLTAGTLTWEALAAAIAEAGTYSTITEAINAGVVIVGEQAVTGLTVVQGGAGTAIYSQVGTALDVAKAAELAATATKLDTAAATLLSGSTGLKLGGLMTLDVGMTSAIAAPLAGVQLGANLYDANPALWTKISQTLLPFCYEENKIRAYVDFVVDSVTGKKKPVVLIATAIIDALKSLFDEEVTLTEKYEKTDTLGRTVAGCAGGPVAQKIAKDLYLYEPKIYQSGQFYPDVNGEDGVWWGQDTIVGDYPNGVYWRHRAGSSIATAHYLGFGTNPYTIEQIIRILSDPGKPVDYFPPTAGVSAPPAPVEPIVWPDTPIIIVPDPLGPDYQPIPVTPVTPLPLPAPEPTPLLPEHVPDPTPDKPAEWPEEEPWPSTIPFPYPDPDPSTEPGPNPDWPEVMPWPLPENPPEEWPKTPENWPYPFPEEVPWPAKPSQWPEEVPWPTTQPDWWPSTVPWPETPEDWPEEVPWPVPWPDDWPTYPPTWPEPFPEELPWPTKPEEWPEEVPWPVTPPDWWPQETPWPVDPESWPDEVPWPLPPPWPMPWPPYYPYPWPFPYPQPSPDPYPDPEKIEDPEKQVDPYVDPWPEELPDPNPDPSPKPDPKPDPERDPTQPEPQPEPKPDPYPDPDPKPDPYNPTPTPPEGEIDPPVPPIIPLPFSSATGLISVYHPTQGELLSFAQWLWVTWQDATIEKVWNNPFDGVISLFELYCTPTDVGRKNIRSGFLDSGVNSAIISRYTEIDCGSIGVPEYFGNYLDYSPYSKCHIYLPFIGVVELNVDDIVGHGVNVTYRIDEYNGSCIAMITVAKSTNVNGVSVDYSNIMYQFSGNCAVELPLSGGSQAAIKAGMIEAAAWGIGSVIGGIMNGATLGDIGSTLAYGAASAVHSVVSAKSSVQHSGSFGSSYGAMGCKKPFIIVTRPKQIQVPNYNELYGYQAHKMVRIGDCTGYIRCREVHVISPTASDEEKAQIEQLLKTGVYITE